MSDNNNVDGRIAELVETGRVKKVQFRPSSKIIWMVVGKDSEYWTDPDLQFCSCKDFYFKTLSAGEPCYHLKGIKKAIEAKSYVTLDFDDGEYAQILKSIAEDNEKLLLRS